MKINSQNWDQHDYGYEVPACSRRELLEIANSVHKAVGYKGEGLFPILHLVEKVFPVVYGKYDFMVVSGKELGNKMGETFPNEHVMKIREDIYDAACAGNAFARSTIGHEASHQIKHEGIQLAFARKANSDLPAYKSSEWQANALSGALLMPCSKISSLSIDEICDRYKVTRSAARTQKKAVEKEMRYGVIPFL